MAPITALAVDPHAPTEPAEAREAPPPEPAHEPPPPPEPVPSAAPPPPLLKLIERPRTRAHRLAAWFAAGAEASFTSRDHEK